MTSSSPRQGENNALPRFRYRMLVASAKLGLHVLVPTALLSVGVAAGLHHGGLHVAQMLTAASPEIGGLVGRMFGLRNSLITESQYLTHE